MDAPEPSARNSKSCRPCSSHPKRARDALFFHAARTSWRTTKATASNKPHASARPELGSDSSHDERGSKRELARKLSPTTPCPTPSCLRLQYLKLKKINAQTNITRFYYTSIRISHIFIATITVSSLALPRLVRYTSTPHLPPGFPAPSRSCSPACSLS